jgi:triacylglycerol lipase
LQDDNTADDRTHYFRRIRSTLMAHGFVVFHSNVSWAAGVSRRAAELQANVERVLRETGAAKVHIVAHSMGGLDGRHMLFEHQADRMHEKVASLSTIGTPHWGTAFADWGIQLGTVFLRLLEILGIDDIDGFKDLTTAACRRFNAAAADFERTCGVTFHAYAGVQDLDAIFEPLRFSWQLIADAEGPNDGLVSLSSARWSDEYFQAPVLNADHLNQLGWWEPNDFRRLPFVMRRSGETQEQLEQRIRQVYIDLATRLARAFPLT